MRRWNKIIDINANTLLEFILIAMSYVCILISKSNTSYWLAVGLFGGFCVARVNTKKIVTFFLAIMMLNPAYINAVIVWMILLTRIKRHSLYTVGNNKTVRFVISFLLLTIILGIYHGLTSNSINEIITWIYILGCVLCCVMYIDIEDAIKGILYMCLLVGCTYILNEFITDVNSRFYFHTPDDNNAGLLLLVGILACRYLNNKKRFHVICVKEVILIMGIIVTRSRGAMLFLIVIYMAAFFRNSSKKKMLAVLCIISVAAVCLFVQGSSTIVTSVRALVSSIFDREMYSNFVRIQLYRTIFTKMLPGNVVFGIGPGNFTEVYKGCGPTFFPEYNAEFVPNHAHNLFLQIMVENGIIGFTILVFWIIDFLLNFYFQVKKKKNSIINITFCVAGLYLVYGMVEYVWTNANIAVLFITLIALTQSQCMQYRRVKNAENNCHHQIINEDGWTRKTNAGNSIGIF